MQVKEPRPAVRAAIRSAVMLLAVSLAACEPTPPVETAPLAQAMRPAQVPADPVLGYVAMGPVGRTAVVDDPAEGGNVIVIINTQYNAASGNICRTYAVTASNAQSQHLACNDGTDWQVVQPLVSSSN